jgi:hypothetical protein
MQVGNDIVNAMFTFLDLMDNFLEGSFEEHGDAAADQAAWARKTEI